DGVPGARPVQRRADGPSPLDLTGVATVAATAPHADQDFIDDRVRPLRARIVRRDPRAIREARRDLAHDRPLATIAIATAAEDDPESATRQLARGREHALESVGSMRIVDDDQERLARADLLEASGHGADGAERPGDRRRLEVERQSHADGTEQVHDVVLAD